MTNLVSITKKVLTMIIIYPIGLFLVGSGGFINYISVITLIQSDLTSLGYLLIGGFFCIGTVIFGCGISLFLTFTPKLE